MNIESPKRLIEVTDIDFYLLGGQTQVTLYPGDTLTVREDSIYLVFQVGTARPSARREDITIYKANLLWVAERQRTIPIEESAYAKLQLGSARAPSIHSAEEARGTVIARSTTVKQPIRLPGKRKSRKSDVGSKRR